MNPRKDGIAKALRFDAFVEAGIAAVNADRDRLAKALRHARKLDRTFSDLHQFTRCARTHASFVGWPVRRRPNGRHT